MRIQHNVLIKTLAGSQKYPPLLYNNHWQKQSRKRISG